MDAVVKALANARKEQGLTQQRLADAAGISRRALVAIEGGGDCTLSTLRRLLRVLDLELVAKPAQHNPPTLDDVMAENESSYQRPYKRPAP